MLLILLLRLVLHNASLSSLASLLRPSCLASKAFLTSCGPKPEQALIGKWQEVKESESICSESIEFVKDGSFHGSLIWDLTNAPTDVSGNFNVNGMNLSIAKLDGLTPMTGKVKFSGSDEVTMLFQQGGALKLDSTSLTYHRAK